jgi:hypothetical protein
MASQLPLALFNKNNNKYSFFKKEVGLETYGFAITACAIKRKEVHLYIYFFKEGSNKKVIVTHYRYRTAPPYSVVVKCSLHSHYFFFTLIINSFLKRLRLSS